MAGLKKKGGWGGGGGGGCPGTHPRPIISIYTEVGTQKGYQLGDPNKEQVGRAGIVWA